MRWVDVASLMVLVGMGFQSYGLYDLHSLGLPFLFVGTEIAIIGLLGVLRGA